VRGASPILVRRHPMIGLSGSMTYSYMNAPWLVLWTLFYPLVSLLSLCVLVSLDLVK